VKPITTIIDTFHLEIGLKEKYNPIITFQNIHNKKEPSWPSHKEDIL
tara:strand:+ start:394 stop:534 length:141 start_codon:yes stop_codon:yes gene_type:complete